jgi:hypothetical protein
MESPLARLIRHYLALSSGKAEGVERQGAQLVVAVNACGRGLIGCRAERDIQRQQMLGRRMGARRMRRPALPVETGPAGRVAAASRRTSRGIRGHGAGRRHRFASRTMSPRLCVRPPEARISTPRPVSDCSSWPEPVVGFGIYLRHHRELDHRNIGRRVHEAQRRPGAVIQAALVVDLNAGERVRRLPPPDRAHREAGSRVRRAPAESRRSRGLFPVTGRRSTSGRSRVPVRRDCDNRARSRQILCASIRHAGPARPGSSISIGEPWETNSGGMKFMAAV